MPAEQILFRSLFFILRFLRMLTIPAGRSNAVARRLRRCPIKSTIRRYIHFSLLFDAPNDGSTFPFTQRTTAQTTRKTLIIFGQLPPSYWQKPSDNGFTALSGRDGAHFAAIETIRAIKRHATRVQFGRFHCFSFIKINFSFGARAENDCAT